MIKNDFKLRQDVRELIFDTEGEKRAVTGSNNEQIFYIFKDSAELGQKILDSYLQRRVDLGGVKAFYSDGKTQKAGYLSNVYGNTGVLSLVNRLGVVMSDEEKADLVKNIYSIVDYIDDNGYTLDPYISPEENRVGGIELFNDNYPYIGAMTWALSFFVSVRRACRIGEISISEAYSEKIIKMILGIIKDFNQAFIDEGDKLGWSFTKECESPSIFFTYSVLEAFSDFDDNVLAETVIEDEDGNKLSVASDSELIERIEKESRGYDKPLHVIWKEKCFKVADRVWEVYGDVLKDNFVDDTFLTGFKPISRDDILKANSSNALFNTIYLVFTLFYGYVNVRLAEAGDTVAANDVVQTMNAALQNTQRIYEQFKRDGVEYIVDTYYIGFKSKHQNERRRDLYTRILNAKMLVDAKLMPTLVKANNVIAFHIEKYPVKQMSRLFIQLMENLPQKEGEFVWEAGAYDVKITERYIESIADFYAYYVDYEKLYSQAFDANTILLDEERERIASDAVKERRRALAAENKRAIAEKEQAIRNEYTIENAIKAGITASTKALILDSIKHLIASNNGQKVALNDFEKSLAELLPELLVSLLGGSVSNACEQTKADPAKVRERIVGDANKFADKWAEKIAKDIDSANNEVISKLLDK